MNHCGLHELRAEHQADSDRIRPNQAEPQAEPSRIIPNQAESDRIRPNTRQSQAESNRTQGRIKQSQTEFGFGIPPACLVARGTGTRSPELLGDSQAPGGHFSEADLLGMPRPLWS